MDIQKPYELLVVEDTPAYREVAESVYSRDSRVHAIYSSDGDEALGMIREGRAELVISDLFFPSKTSWTAWVLPEIREGIAGEMKDEYARRERPYAVNALSIERFANKQKEYARYIEKLADRDLYIGFEQTAKKHEITVEDVKKLSENPSGLGIALECAERKIPYKIISQGSRRGDNSGIWRHALQYSDTLKALTSSEDPLSQMSVCGEWADKNDPYDWKKTLDVLLKECSHPP